MKLTIKQSACLILLAVVSIGCFQMRDNQSNSESSLAPFPQDPNAEDPVIPGAMTVAVAGQTRMDKHYQNILKVTTPTAGTGTKFVAKVGSLTIDGVPKTLNAPALMASVDIVSEYCEDLYDQENAGGATKRFFVDVNLTAGTAQFSPTILDSLILKFSRAAWQRAPATDEKTTLLDGILSVQTGNTAADTKKVLIFICTSVLASLDGMSL